MLVYMCRNPHIPVEHAHAQRLFYCCHWFYMVLISKAINFLQFHGLIYFDKTYVTYVHTYLTWWAFGRVHNAGQSVSVSCKC